MGLAESQKADGYRGFSRLQPLHHVNWSRPRGHHTRAHGLLFANVCALVSAKGNHLDPAGWQLSTVILVQSRRPCEELPVLLPQPNSIFHSPAEVRAFLSVASPEVLRPCNHGELSGAIFC